MMMPLAVVMAAGSAPTGNGPDLSPLWLQYGAIGVICAVLIWFAYRATSRESARADRMEAEVARLNQVILDQSRSTVEATTAMREVITYLQGHMTPPRSP